MIDSVVELSQIVSISFMVAAIFKRARIVENHRVPLVALGTGMLIGGITGLQTEGLSGLVGGILFGMSGLAATGLWEGAKAIGGESNSSLDDVKMYE